MTTEKTDYETLSGPQLVTAYNHLVRKAQEAGLDGYRELRVFHDKPTAVARCVALESSIRARAEGLSSSPGLARLRAHPDAETIRQDTLRKQDEARDAAAVRPTEPRGILGRDDYPEPKKEKTVAKKVKEKTNGGGRRSSVPMDGKIELLAEGNPKREGTKAHALYAMFRNNMKVATFVEKADAEYGKGAGFGEIRWCVNKEFIRIMPA